MIVGEIAFEPSEHLWSAVPVFLLALLVLDGVVLRPRWRVLMRRTRGQRWRGAILAVGLLVAVIWRRPGVPPGAAWWFPAWSLVLFWAIAARVGGSLADRLGRSWPKWVVPIGCAVGAGLSLLALARAEPPQGEGLLPFALIGLVVLTGLWIRRSYLRRSETRPGGQRLPLALRTLALLLLAILLVNPLERHVHVSYERACLLILLDDSRSMAIRDVVPVQGQRPLSRVAALNSALAVHRFELDRIRRELDLRAYWFTDRLTEAETLRVRAGGDYTALGDAIQQAYESALQDGRPVAGVVVASDGASNLSSLIEPGASASALAAGHVPLWTVGVGSETPSGETRTILPRTLSMARRVAAMNELPIVAEFSFVGMKGQPVRVELLFDDELVDRRRFTCTENQQTQRSRFTFVPRVGGLHKVTVQARPERIQTKAPPPTMSQYLYVTDEVIRVLYLEGKPRYEGTFIVRALAQSKQIRLHKAVLARPKDDDLRTAPGGPAGEWQWYHVILIGDMGPGQLTPGQMDAIRHHVGDNGCGLAVLGSRGFLGAGAFAGTPLADVLPFETVVGWTAEPTGVIPTEAGVSHAVCRIGESPEGLAQRWHELPPMRGACRFGRPKPAAQVLAVSDKGYPMIVGHQYGAGRVLSLAFGSTWQWCMLRDDAGEAHRRFWRQVILWLANRRPAVWIAADKPRYQLPLLREGRQRVEVRAGVDNPISGQPVEDIKLEARMVTKDGQATPLALTASEDHYIATADPAADGTYRLELVAKSGDRKLGQAVGQFVVESPDLEMIRPMADFDLLREMAGRTRPAGGKFVTLDGLSGVLAQVGTHDYRRRHEETITNLFTYDRRWGLWLLFCGLLLLEWIVRKRRGLV